MRLATRYLGLELAHPFVPGASPLADDLDNARRLEDAGAPALVLHSLFEEQIAHEQAHHAAGGLRPPPSDARRVTPGPERFAHGPEDYLEHLARLRHALSIPVIASLNGTTLGGWLSYARFLQQAGASALELNVYSVASDPHLSSAAIEARTVEMLCALKEQVDLPIAVKLSPFYTGLAHFARQLEEAGADGLVLFNRFYQPEIDVEDLATVRSLYLSHHSELSLRLRWLAILSAHQRCSLAATGAVHTGLDAARCILAGAHVVQVVSMLLQHGPEHLRVLREELSQWMERRGFESLERFRASLNLHGCPSPEAYERANYMLVLQGWSRG